MRSPKIFVLLVLITVYYPCSSARKHLYSRAFDNFYEVEKDTFYRSKQLTPKKLRAYIKRFNIKTIINLRGRNEHTQWWNQERGVAKACGVNFFSIPMSARRFPHKKDLLFLLHLYNRAPRPILVHCRGGADRAGEAAALWVFEQQNKGRKAALKQLRIKYGHIKWFAPTKRQFIKSWAHERKVL